MSRPPLPALLLGAAGLLPPLASIAIEWMLRGSPDPEPSAFMAALPAIGYAALILSFLGGMWWGVAATRIAPERLWSWLAMAVAPSLWAAGAFFGGRLAQPPRGAAILIAMGLLASPLGDLRFVRARLVPDWWMALRVPLSCGLALETIAVALLA